MWWGMFIPCRVALGSTLAAILILGAACPWNSVLRRLNCPSTFPTQAIVKPFYTASCSCWEKATAPHSSALAWKIPWMEEPGGLQSMGSLRVGHDFHFSLSCNAEWNGNPLQWSCLENRRDGEPGGLPSMGSHRVRHDWSDLVAAACSYLAFSWPDAHSDAWNLFCLPWDTVLGDRMTLNGNTASSLLWLAGISGQVACR